MYSSSPCQINNPDLLWDLSYGAFPIKSEICISRFIGAPWNLVCSTIPMGEGYSPEKGYGDVRPSIPPFHASPAVHKTSEINVKFCLQNQQFSENMASFSSRSSNLAQIFVKKLRNLINYQFSSPRFDESPLTSPPSSQFILSQAPKVQKSRPHMPTRKKLSAPPLRQHHTHGQGGGMFR